MDGPTRFLFLGVILVHANLSKHILVHWRKTSYWLTRDHVIWFVNSRWQQNVFGVSTLKTLRRKMKNVEEKVVVVHRGRYNNNKVHHRLSHDVVT